MFKGHFVDWVSISWIAENRLHLYIYRSKSHRNILYGVDFEFVKFVERILQQRIEWMMLSTYHSNWTGKKKSPFVFICKSLIYRAKLIFLKKIKVWWNENEYGDHSKLSNHSRMFHISRIKSTRRFCYGHILFDIREIT